MSYGNSMSQDSTVEAEYSDGYVVSELERKDVSEFVEGKNTFHDILTRQYEELHGKMVRFSVFWQGKRYNVDWLALPDNARPIRFRHGNFQTNTETGEQTFWWSGVDFGYQYTDENGENKQEVVELR
jgi:hypothetical protein